MNPYHGHHHYQPQPPPNMMKPPFGFVPPGGGPFFPPPHPGMPPFGFAPPHPGYAPHPGFPPPHPQSFNHPMHNGHHQPIPPHHQPQHFPIGIPGSFQNQKPPQHNGGFNNSMHHSRNINNNNIMMDSPSPPHPSSSNKINNNIISNSSPTTNAPQPANNNITNTNAYIGKIPAFVEDSFIKTLLDQCGKVIKWNRAETNGKFKAFGICEFEHAEGAATALRMLNDLEVDRDGGKLVVKVDKSQKFYSDYMDKKNIDQSTDPQDIILREAIKASVEKNLINIYEKKKMESNEINDFYNKDRRDLTKEEKIKIIEREKEKEKQRFKEREIKNKERDLKDFKEREKNWERRERTKELDREKEKEKEKEKEIKEIKARQLEMDEYSDSDEKMRKRIRSREAVKYRQKEREDDEKDRLREQAELAELEVKRQKEEELNRIQLTGGSGIDQSKKSLKLSSKFNEDDDEQTEEDLKNNLLLSTKKKQTFIPLDYNEIDQVLNPQQYQAQQLLLKQKEQEEKEREEKAMIDSIESLVNSKSIPLDKDQVYKMNLNWDLIDSNSIIDDKMKPWVTKKVIEFFGTQEDELIHFILNLLKSHLSSSDIISKLKDVFESSADDFVFKMWRIMLYYTNK